jgi:hypothetical protein
VLQATGITLSALIGGTGAVAAKSSSGNSQRKRQNHPPSDRQGPPKYAATQGIKIENDRFKMTVSRSEWENIDLTEMKGVPERAKQVPYGVVEEAIEDFNEALDAGHLGFEERNGRRVVVPQTNSLEIARGDE